MGIFIWKIRGEVIKIQAKGIRIVTEKGRKFFILKCNESYKFDYDKLKLETGDKIEATILPIRSKKLIHWYEAQWVSKVIWLGSRYIVQSITLHPDYPELIMLNSYFNGMCGYRGKIKKIHKNGIEVEPDNLDGQPSPNILILKRKGNYEFDFNKLDLQINDKIEASIIDIEKQVKIVRAKSITKQTRGNEIAITLCDPDLELY